MDFDKEEIKEIKRRAKSPLKDYISLDELRRRVNKKIKPKKWRRIDPKKNWTQNGVPKDVSFLLYDAKCSSGLSVYEALLFDDGSVQCPATFEDFKVEEFSHWRPMIKLPKGAR